MGYRSRQSFDTMAYSMQRLMDMPVRPDRFVFLALCVAGCTAATEPPPGQDTDPIVPTASACHFEPALLHAPLGKDAIPALSDPLLVAASGANYLQPTDRILGITVGSQAIAVPHNILWHHEVVNIEIDGLALAVTYCPLTGSGIVFERTDIGAAEFGVSGLLYRNNLVMHDRRASESLWPQMEMRARCGPSAALPLFTYPVLETTWAGWQRLHPSTRVVSDQTGHDRDYTRNPYGNYGDPANASLLYAMPVDDRLLPKQRVLGLPNAGGGLAFSLQELDDGNASRVVHTRFGSLPIVVFWVRAFDSAMVFQLTQGLPEEFIADGDTFRDTQTGSRWRIDGRAVEGEMAGRQLRPVNKAYFAYWFAWAAFQPDAAVWRGD